MKRQVTGILIGTMFAMTAATLPASATVTNTNSQHLIDAENNDTQQVKSPSPSNRRRITLVKKQESFDSRVSNFLHNHNIPTSTSEWQNLSSTIVHDTPTFLSRLFSQMFSQVKSDYHYLILGGIMASIASTRARGNK